MSAADLLQRLVAELDAASVPHMVAGSFASTFHGEPRTTFDIVIVIDPSLEAFEALLVSLRDEDYYLDRDVARDAFRRRSQFNLVDLATGWKVDLIVRKNRPFSVAEFERRRRGSILGVEVFVATAEDTIIAKLEWATLGASERQLRDIAGILSVRADALDLDYIEGWVTALGLGDGWRRARGS